MARCDGSRWCCTGSLGKRRIRATPSWAFPSLAFSAGVAVAALQLEDGLRPARLSRRAVAKAQSPSNFYVFYLYTAFGHFALYSVIIFF
jgi:hypothetical protein